MAREGATTTFKVLGGGFIIGRVASELGIARTVATAIMEAYPSAGNGWPPTRR